MRWREFIPHSPADLRCAWKVLKMSELTLKVLVLSGGLCAKVLVLSENSHESIIYVWAIISQYPCNKGFHYIFHYSDIIIKYYS